MRWIGTRSSPLRKLVLWPLFHGLLIIANCGPGTLLSSRLFFFILFYFSLCNLLHCWYCPSSSVTLFRFHIPQGRFNSAALSTWPYQCISVVGFLSLALEDLDLIYLNFTGNAITLLNFRQERFACFFFLEFTYFTTNSLESTWLVIYGLLYSKLPFSFACLLIGFHFIALLSTGRIETDYLLT